MKSPILLTIPRTGTGFFKKLLLQHYKPIGLSDVVAGEVGLVVSHVSRASLEQLEKVTNPFVITTWRNWDKVQESFNKHGDPIRLFDAHNIAWTGLVRQYKPFILTIEPDYNYVSREARLTILGELLGIEFSTDWTPVNQWEEK